MLFESEEFAEEGTAGGQDDSVRREFEAGGASRAVASGARTQARRTSGTATSQTDHQPRKHFYSLHHGSQQPKLENIADVYQKLCLRDDAKMCLSAFIEAFVLLAESPRNPGCEISPGGQGYNGERLFKPMERSRTR